MSIMPIKKYTFPDGTSSYSIYPKDFYTTIWKEMPENWKKNRKRIDYVKEVFFCNFNIEKIDETANIIDVRGRFIDEDDECPLFFLEDKVFMSCISGKKYFNRSDFIFTFEQPDFNFIKDSIITSDNKEDYGKGRTIRFLAPIIRRETSRLYKEKQK